MASRTSGRWLITTTVSVGRGLLMGADAIGGLITGTTRSAVDYATTYDDR
jgi:hypothetical protein